MGIVVVPEKISRGRYFRSEEFKKKMSDLQKNIAIDNGIKKGDKHFNYGRKHSQKAKENMRASHSNVKTGKEHFNYGKKASSESRMKMSQAQLKSGNKPKVLFGENHPNWKGTTPLIIGIRNLFNYRQWRCDVFTRDKFTCVECGDDTGGNLQADHIVPLSYLVRKYEITSTESSLKCEAIWDINNGRTLCKPCHKKTDTFGFKALKFLEV